MGTNTLDFRESGKQIRGVDNKQQTEAFGEAIDKLVDRFANEYDLTYATIIGTLQMKIIYLAQESEQLDDEDQDENG